VKRGMHLHIFYFSCLVNDKITLCMSFFNLVNNFLPGDSRLICGTIHLVNFYVGTSGITCRRQLQSWISLSAGSPHHRIRHLLHRHPILKTPTNRSMTNWNKYRFYLLVSRISSIFIISPHPVLPFL
jgi:hypothetical protein